MPATLPINTNCPICGTTATVQVDPTGYKLWKTGENLIQDALPDLDLDQREQLMTGICPTCWISAFGEPANSDHDEYDLV